MKNEFERRYLMVNPSVERPYEELARERSTKHCIQKFDIMQLYDDKGLRYRKFNNGTSVKYEKCLKEHVSDGFNKVTEEEITDYEFYMNMYMSIRCVIKRRISWTDRKDGYLYCIDFFDELGLIIMEIETPVQMDEIKIPLTLCKKVIKDITGDKCFSNFELQRFY